MPESVIITLTCEGQQADFELPAKVPLKRVEEPLMQAMRLGFPRLSMRGKLSISGPDGLLSPEHTLEEYGIFDGAILSCTFS